MKREIPKEDGRLKYYCNEAHFWVADKLLPKDASIDSHKTLALAEGFMSGVLVSHFGEWLIEKANHHGANLDLESITSHCLTATVAIPVGARLIAPKYLRQYIEENPIYSAGVVGVMGGASGKALSTLFYLNF